MAALSSDAIRVLIADDNALLRDGLRTLLQNVRDCTVVGEADNALRTVESAASLQPDLILLDSTLPGHEGSKLSSESNSESVESVRIIRQILHTSPRIKIIILTVYEDDAVFAGLRAGARGYLPKGAIRSEFSRAIRGVNSGDVMFGAAFARRLLQFFANLPDLPLGGIPVPRQFFPRLTDTEREILMMISGNGKPVDIADRLNVTPKMVRNHAANMLTKAHVAENSLTIIRSLPGCCELANADRIIYYI